MIKEQFVEFETAKLLKDKGFDEPTLFCYFADRLINNFELSNNSKRAGISAPTQQMACKWLREVHNLCLFIIPATIDETFRTGYALYPQCDSRWEWCASKNDRNKATFGVDINKKYCDSYEEAVEAACIYALKNLI